jgi:hypothetical protein
MTLSIVEQNKKLKILQQNLHSLIDDSFFQSFDSGRLLYHYTNHQGFSGILTSSSLWATDSLYLNDSSELSFGFELLKQSMIEKLGEHFDVPNEKDIAEVIVDSTFQHLEESSQRIYVTSFCEEGDLLSQWRGYAGASGVSIGFNYPFFKNTIEKLDYPLGPVEWGLSKVLYGEEAKLLADKISLIAVKELKIYLQDESNTPRTVGNWHFSRILNSISDIYQYFICSVKHDGFKEEKEWRLIGIEKGIPLVKYRTSATEIVPYIKFKFPDDFYKKYTTGNLEKIAVSTEADDTERRNIDEEEPHPFDSWQRPKEDCDGPNYIKQIFIGPTAHFKRRKRAVEEVIRSMCYPATSSWFDRPFDDKGPCKDKLSEYYHSDREKLHQFRRNFYFEMPDILQSSTPLI